MIPNRLKASSLVYALFIVLLITLVVSSVIALVFYQQFEFEYNLTTKRLITNANSGIYALLTESADLTANEGIEKDLYGKGKDLVKLSLKTWGIMDVGISTAHSSRQSISRMVLIGAVSTDSSANIALYLPDNKEPLKIAGNTTLKGNCYLPKAGVKSAFIEGSDYKGGKLVYGYVFPSAVVLPELNASVKNKIEYILSNAKAYAPDSGNIEIPDTITRSFYDETLIIKSSNTLEIKHNSFSGNIILYSSKNILVSKEAHLQDVILISPFIEFESGFHGSLQAFATDSLILGTDSYLQYPSAITLSATGDSYKCIKLEKGATVAGTIIVTQPTVAQPKSIVLMEEKSLLTGLLYCQGVASLRGTIRGSAYTKDLQTLTMSGVYKNYLLNSVIDVSALPPNFSCSPIFAKNQKPGICKWVN